MAADATKTDLHHDAVLGDCHRYRFTNLDTSDTVVAAAPGSGWQHVVVGMQVTAASAELDLVVEDGSNNNKLLLLLPEPFSGGGRPILPPPAEPGTLWVPIGDDEPLEVRTSASVASGVIYYVTVPV